MRFDLEQIEEAMEQNGVGFCVKCGMEHDCCEPDARKYPCENGCGNHVYGAEELLMMGLVS